MQIDVQMPIMTDPHGVPDVIANGLGEIEDLGGCYRFTLYATRTALDGTTEHVVAARVVVPNDALPSILFLAARHIGLTLVQAANFFSRTIH